jgi:predicted nucleic acid-binding protein
VNSLVIDTNIVFSILISDKRIASFFDILANKVLFVSSDVLFLEIEEHWDRIISLANKPEQIVKERYNSIKELIYIIDLSVIPTEIYEESIRICTPIDSDDIPYIAICLYLGIPFWTGDSKLRRGLERQGYFVCMNSEEIAKRVIET